jgi:hypothetical protein
MNGSNGTLFKDITGLQLISGRDSNPARSKFNYTSFYLFHHHVHEGLGVFTVP